MASGKIFSRFYARVGNASSSSLPKSSTYYTTLGISPSATQREIKSKYYSLSLQCHPDTVQTYSTAYKTQFAQLNEAYSVLGNPRKRQDYDMELGIFPKSKSYSTSDGSSHFDFNEHYSKSFRQTRNQGMEAASHQALLVYSLGGSICGAMYLIYEYFPNISKRELSFSHEH